MKKVKNTIPVYDICSLKREGQWNAGIIVEPFAAYLAHHPNLHFPHRHSFYHIVLFARGAGYHSIDFERFPVSAGQIYFMKPGQVHSWNFEGDTDGYIINFSESLFQHFLLDIYYPDTFPFFQGIAAESVFILKEQAFADVALTIEKMLDEVRHNEPQTPDMLKTYLLQLLILSARDFSSKGRSVQAYPQNQLLLYNFRKLVETHYMEKRLPKEYAALLYVTPNHLNALCKDRLGRSAGEVIRDRILLEAKRLLMNVQLSISAIAHSLDFTDSSHFTKFFKKYTRQTPEEFRKHPLIL